jgi:hypothetical protein
LPTKKETEAEAQATVERKDLLRQAYGKATARLRDEHREDFNKFYAEAAKDLGVDWSPRPSDEEKAARAFEQLLIDYPDLANRVNKEGATE